jgi:hypothetical protein
LQSGKQNAAFGSNVKQRLPVGHVLFVM